MQITALHRADIVARLVQFMSAYGYELVETPIVESAELFLTKAGYQLIDRLLAFERVGHALTLRPEFTAGALYRYIHTFHDQQPIVRWQFNGPVFEERSGTSEPNYQRHSIGAELIGMDGPSTEAEIIAMAALGLRETSAQDWQLHIGHVGLMKHLLAHFGLDSRTLRFVLSVRHMLKDPAYTKADVIAALDRYLSVQNRSAYAQDAETNTNDAFSTESLLDTLLTGTERGATMGGRTREDIARRLLQKRKRASEREQIIAAVDFLQAWGAIASDATSALPAMRALIDVHDSVGLRYLAQWGEVLELLTVYGVPNERIIIQPDLARTWDYYTGIVFELRTSTDIQIGGGGRYDELAHLIGDTRDIPAVGFAYYLDELLSISAAPVQLQSPLGIEVAPETRAAAAKWAGLLREHGFQVALLPSVERGTSDIPRVLAAEQDGTLLYAGRAYTIDQIELLFTELSKK